jgi:phosphoribosylformylglycinamidine synthase
MAEACRALDFPIVSGNVSLYNETEGRPIMPTPVIGGVGLLADVQGCVDIALREAGLALLLVGETGGHLGQSIFLREIHGREQGAPPPVDLAVERRNGDFVRGQIGVGHVAACHDLSDGGLLIALTEMAMAGATGATIEIPGDIAPHAWLFGEDQGRYLLATSKPDAVLAEAAKAGVPAWRIGTSGGNALTINGLMAISLAEVRRVHETWLPAYMAGEAA